MFLNIFIYLKQQKLCIKNDTHIYNNQLNLNRHDFLLIFLQIVVLSWFLVLAVYGIMVTELVIIIVEKREGNQSELMAELSDNKRNRLAIWGTLRVNRTFVILAR